MCTVKAQQHLKKSDKSLPERSEILKLSMEPLNLLYNRNPVNERLSGYLCWQIVESCRGQKQEIYWSESDANVLLQIYCCHLKEWSFYGGLEDVPALTVGPLSTADR